MGLVFLFSALAFWSELMKGRLRMTKTLVGNTGQAEHTRG